MQGSSGLGRRGIGSLRRRSRLVLVCRRIPHQPGMVFFHLEFDPVDSHVRETLSRSIQTAIFHRFFRSLDVCPWRRHIGSYALGVHRLLAYLCPVGVRGGVYSCPLVVRSSI